MGKITIDRELRDKLNGLNAEIAFCDESGQVVGHYIPADQYRKMLYAVAAAEISDQEIDQARQETGGQSLKEFWKTLGQP